MSIRSRCHLQAFTGCMESTYSVSTLMGMAHSYSSFCLALTSADHNLQELPRNINYLSKCNEYLTLHKSSIYSKFAHQLQWYCNEYFYFLLIFLFPNMSFLLSAVRVRYDLCSSKSSPRPLPAIEELMLIVEGVPTDGTDNVCKLIEQLAPSNRR